MKYSHTLKGRVSKNKMEEEYDEYEDEEESEGLILSFDKEGKGAKLTSKKDFDNAIEKQQELITEFIKENVELFKKFLEKKGISEKEFNGELKQGDGNSSQP